MQLNLRAVQREARGRELKLGSPLRRKPDAAAVRAERTHLHLSRVSEGCGSESPRRLLGAISAEVAVIIDRSGPTIVAHAAAEAIGSVHRTDVR